MPGVESLVRKSFKAYETKRRGDIEAILSDSDDDAITNDDPPED